MKAGAFAEARRDFETALDWASAADVHPLVGRALLGLSKVCEERGEFKPALEYRKRIWRSYQRLRLEVRSQREVA